MTNLKQNKKHYFPPKQPLRWPDNNPTLKKYADIGLVLRYLQFNSANYTYKRKFNTLFHFSKFRIIQSRLCEKIHNAYTNIILLL